MAIPIPEKRISDFEKLGFGMFIHWGVYSQLGKGEWIMHIHKIPKDEYSKLINTFTASKFDANKGKQINNSYNRRDFEDRNRRINTRPYTKSIQYTNM